MKEALNEAKKTVREINRSYGIWLPTFGFSFIDFAGRVNRYGVSGTRINGEHNKLCNTRLSDFGAFDDCLSVNNSDP